MKVAGTFFMALAVMLTASCANPFMSGADFVNADGAKLEIELIVPEGGRAAKPAVIFAVGSNAADFRDYTPGFRETLIEDVFLPRDIVVVYVNKRGLGESSGNWRWSSIEQRAEDVITVADYLRTLEQIDPDAIGLIGHSQGGWVVQEAGSLDPDLAFIIALAGPTVSVREQDMQRAENELICEGRTEAEIEVALERLDQKHERNISVGRWFPFFSLRYASNIFQYDPRDAIAGLTQPTLFTFGERDYLVPPAQNYERFDEIFGSTGAPDNITLYTAGQANHSFHVVESMCVSYEDSLEEPYSTEITSYLGIWVDSLGL